MTQPDVPSAAGADWEELADGSLGRATEFLGVEDTPIAAYIRKPAGNGPFPVIVCMHGGRDSQQATFGLGRSQNRPVADFVKAGWALYSADYRHQDKIAIFPILIVNGRDDDNSPPSVIEAYVTALREADKEVGTYEPDHGPHGFYLGHPDLPETQEAARRAVAFFQHCFGR